MSDIGLSWLVASDEKSPLHIDSVHAGNHEHVMRPSREILPTIGGLKEWIANSALSPSAHRIDHPYLAAGRHRVPPCLNWLAKLMRCA